MDSIFGNKLYNAASNSSYLCIIFLIFTEIAKLQIRLNGSGNNISGRVEIFIPNVGWGTICDYYWGISDGNVVCRQLGFTGANEVRNRAYYGDGSGPILLTYVGCYGTESYIWDCSHSAPNKHDCSHSSDAGVECLCKKNYTFDGAGCVGMYPLLFKNIIMYVYNCTSVIIIIFISS
jgi:deleted-in-malignant-brain-tumors protein 1